MEIFLVLNIEIADHGHEKVREFLNLRSGYQLITGNFSVTLI